MEIPGKRPELLVHQREPLNLEPPRAALAGRALTPLDAFYVRCHGPVVETDGERWELTVGGLVDRPLRLTLGQLTGGELEVHEVVATLQCAGNRRAGLMEVREIPGEAPWGPGATGTARWRGVRLADVLALAGVREDACHVGLVGADRSDEAQPAQLYGASIPLSKALGEEVLLAFEMNGAPLQAVHGRPLRAVVPGYVGARSVKWLERIEVRRDPWEGYYQSTAYRLLTSEAEPAPGAGMALQEIALNADFLSSDDGAEVAAGEIRVSGYAIAGGERVVSRVDVSGDGGETWGQAELGPDQGRWAWRLWEASLRVEPGERELVARTWDSAAAVQPERPETVWNPKGYVNNSWARIRVRVAPERA